METTTVPVAETQAIMNELKKQANAILSSTSGVNLEGFHVGSTGNFPYTWQDPSNLKFNQKTYDWIKSALESRKAGDDVTLKGVFTNEYLEAITDISYSLSSADKVKLNKINADTTQQQGAVLSSWQAAYGSLPTPGAGSTVIDEITTVIRTKWATDPATTLAQMQNARDLTALLGNAPASAMTIIPVFANYLNAIGSGISLIDSVTLYGGIISDLKNAINNPSATNGGILTNKSGANYIPDYPVATQNSDILNGLKDTGNAIKLNMSVSKYSSSEVKVSVSGSTGFNIPVLDFFSLGGSGSASYFKDTLVQKSSNIEIDMEFTGVTMVEFGPKEYDISSRLGWMYADPIAKAIANEGKDVSGYKFSPASQIDFSKNGPFGYLSAVGISNYPTIKITATSSDYESIKTSFEQESSWKVSFLGIPLGSASQSYSKTTVNTDSSTGSVSITLSPPAEFVAGTAIDSVGFVLGVQAEYPAS